MQTDPLPFLAPVDSLKYFEYDTINGNVLFCKNSIFFPFLTQLIGNKGQTLYFVSVPYYPLFTELKHGRIYRS